MVLMSSDEARTCKCPTLVVRVRRGSPCSISATSVEVPPTSNVKIFFKPAFLATQIAPATPPAGPDISRETGYSTEASVDIRPPSERNSANLPVMPNARRRL